ncbi:hypothetical protein TanjilG_16276 [Lupinus angustifolius]|uniref:DUF7803 domain-containing protein n=1 Tax=Lupinus angustifolius TaxID=3871 RepID=A0A1J7I2R1_LUPAN|nr:hypothetical protein TanjilG_16276 [Lupinus angustifolius]
MDVDSQPTMEETILVGDDLMTGPPSPVVPPEIASHVLQGVDLCDGVLKNMFLCLQINDIEPFCQDELVLYKQCSERRDKEIRKRLQDSEHKLGSSMPLDKAKERATQLEAEVTTLERRLILASGAEGLEGFRQRWSLHGRLTDSKKRLEALKQVGAEAEEAKIELLLNEVKGKSVVELIASGREKLASVPSGGGAVAVAAAPAGGAGGAAAPAAEAKEEKKVEEKEESDDDMGFSLFD